MAGIGNRRRDQIFEQIFVVTQQIRIQLDTACLMLAVERDLDHASTGFADDFQFGDLILHGLHLGLHLLRLLHQVAQSTFHSCPRLVPRTAAADQCMALSPGASLCMRKLPG